ncbi:recombinase family protein [Aneurinibacillus sp. BA2021]|nr:recombinase family protein [Aneurinibacillus sp. BA2021]
MRAAIYARVSTEEQAKEGYSIDAQKNRLVDFVNSQGWEIHDFYIDDGFSAKDLNRPQMQRMILDIKRKQFDVVLVYKLDRMVRSVMNLYELLQVFDKHGVSFKSATEAFDTTSAMGRFFITLVGAMAQWERENLAERVKMGMEEKALKGGRNGSHAPFGYDIVDGELKVNAYEAELVKQIFEMYQEKGMSGIVWHLNRSGIKKRNFIWNKRAVQYLLSNPVYIGKIRWNYQKAGGKVRSGEEIITDGSHEAIISEELFEKTQELMNQRYRIGKPATSDYIFSGVLRCNRCGYSFSGYSSKRKHTIVRMYRCSGKVNKGICDMPDINESALEEIFLEWLKWDLKEETKGKIEVEPAPATASDEEILRLEDELKKIEKRKQKWQEAFANDAFEVSRFKELMAEERGKEEFLMAQLKKISHGKSPMKKISQRDISEQVDNIVAAWKKIDNATKKKLVLALFSLIKIDSELKKAKKGPKPQVPVHIVEAELVAE